MHTLSARLRRLGLSLLILVAGLSLGACGSSTTPAGQPGGSNPNNWDSMQWDQGTWG